MWKELRKIPVWTLVGFAVVSFMLGCTTRIKKQESQQPTIKTIRQHIERARTLQERKYLVTQVRVCQVLVRTAYGEKITKEFNKCANETFGELCKSQPEVDPTCGPDISGYCATHARVQVRDYMLDCLTEKPANI